MCMFLFLGQGEHCTDVDRGASRVKSRLQTGTCYLSEPDLLSPDTGSFTTKILTIYLNRVHSLCSTFQDIHHSLSTSTRIVHTQTHVVVISWLRNANGRQSSIDGVTQLAGFLPA